MDYDYMKASDGTGDAPLMHVQADRSPGSSTLSVDTITKVPAKFIGTVGTPLPSGLLDPATITNFKGHTNAGALQIDSYEPGSTDVGNVAGQVVIIKPTTSWANRVAQFMMNYSGLGTVQNAFVAALQAVSVTTSGNSTVGGSQSVSGNQTIGGNITISGTSQLVAVSVTSADASNNITPTKQLFNITALGHDATVLTPTFTATDGITGEIQIKDDGNARALTWPSGWVAIGASLPTTTTAGKYMYIGYRYNAADSKWHVRSVARQN